jgi:hypothetical protein
MVPPLKLTAELAPVPPAMFRITGVESRTNWLAPLKVRLFMLYVPAVKWTVVVPLTERLPYVELGDSEMVVPTFVHPEMVPHVPEMLCVVVGGVGLGTRGLAGLNDLLKVVTPVSIGDALEELVIPLPGQAPVLVFGAEKFPSILADPLSVIFPFVLTFPPLAWWVAV